MGSPATVPSPRTGSAMIWAACLPSAHSAHLSVPDEPPPPVCGAAAGGVPPFPATGVADVRLLRNQLDVAESVACAVSRVSAPDAMDTPDGMDTSDGMDKPDWKDAGTASDWLFVNWPSVAERVTTL